MIDELATVARHAFDYPAEPLSRRHGPLGYTDYRSFKPWLRDEFSFRCILCLDRDRWHPNGQEEFSVDHVEPRSIVPGRVTNYHNLLYTCCSCNRNRRAAVLPLDPCRDVLGEHLAVRRDGMIQGLTRISHKGERFLGREGGRRLRRLAGRYQGENFSEKWALRESLRKFGSPCF